jgi:hypothetical protein
MNKNGKTQNIHYDFKFIQFKNGTTIILFGDTDMYSQKANK